MRTVFNSNDQFANVFASQTQFNGRTNSMFFERDTAYSYGRHYIAAKFMIADNGEKVCFINKNPYSNSTAKHCRKLWNAIPDGIKVFRLSFGSWIDRDNLPELIKKEIREIERLLSKQLTARTNWLYFYDANEMIKDIQEICFLFGLNVPDKYSFLNYQKASVQCYKLRLKKQEKVKGV
jgi:hypothetical protein